MGQPGVRGGEVIDDGGSDGVDTGVKDDGFALTNLEDGDKTIAKPSGEADPNGGTENLENGEDAGNVEGEVNQEGTESGTENQPPIKEIVQQALEEAFAKNKPQEPIKERTAEEWAAMEQEWGAPRSTIERVTRQSVTVYNKVMDVLDARMSKYELSDSLNSLSKEQGFQDANRYKNDITKYLSRYETKHWTNPQLLKDAVIYSRGLNANANVQKARNESERNRVVAGKARPSAPGGGQRRVSLPALTSEQREAAAMMPGGEQQYRQFKNKGRVTIE